MPHRRRTPPAAKTRICICWKPCWRSTRQPGGRETSPASERFIDPESGALLEDFSPDWTPLQPRGKNRVEPGHQFEWYWLLGEYRRLGGTVPEAVTDRLLMFAIDNGLDQETGLIVDAVTDSGGVLIPSFRSWPHAEGVKALVTATREGQPGAAEMADHLMASLLSFAPDSMEGGWMDRIDVDGSPLVDHMPASTLYHMMGALFEADEAFGSKASG
jgi:mannose/cellobiose epimerase-like protein (N-acyl-D-glucosamine 2-epimerase family)